MPNFEAMSFESRNFRFRARKLLQKFGVKSGLIQKRLKYGKKYFTWLYVVRCFFIPTYSIQFNLLRQRKDYSVIKVNRHEFIFTKLFYQTKANKQAKYSKKQITRKFTAKNDKVMFKVISQTGTSHPPIRNDNYW